MAAVRKKHDAVTAEPRTAAPPYRPRREVISGVAFAEDGGVPLSPPARGDIWSRFRRGRRRSACQLATSEDGGVPVLLPARGDIWSRLRRGRRRPRRRLR